MKKALQSTGSHLNKAVALPASTRAFYASWTFALDKDGAKTGSGEQQESKEPDEKPPQQKKKKTLAEMDAELQANMEGRSGDGGLAGAELEGGKAVSMKRGVRDNMFRYI